MLLTLKSAVGSVGCNSKNFLLSRLATATGAGCLSRLYSRWEPDDIEYEPAIPEYEALNIQMKGYDYVVLESFLKYVNTLTKSLGLDATSFASPAATATVKTYKPFSTNILNEYNLAVYERNVQVTSLPNTLAPTLIETLQQNTPSGVSVKVKQPDLQEDDFRYVPDLVLRELKSQLDDIDRDREERRKK